MLIGGFQPFSLSDYPGFSAALVFTQGCNFRCPYCHNRRLWPRTTAPLPLTAEDVLTFMETRRGKLGGVVVTGGEPTLQADLADFFRQLKKAGWAVKLDTNGSRPEVLEALLEADLVDFIAMDVKAPWPKYDQLCGGPVDRAAIGRSMALVSAGGVPHHFRTTIFPPLLDEEDIAAVKDLLPPGSAHHIQDYREP